jgi:flavin reductase (DIM6/NTAB) family NADH-FMN oxidoreductase RutF
VDQNQYRRVIGGFATGVTVVTALTADGAPEGMTANSLTSVSLEPILLAVCFHRDSGTITAIRETRAFVVNLLAEDERELSVRFAGGDHYIVLGEVESCVERPGRPLLFFKGQYGRLQ